MHQYLAPEYFHFSAVRYHLTPCMHDELEKPSPRWRPMRPDSSPQRWIELPSINDLPQACIGLGGSGHCSQWFPPHLLAINSTIRMLCFPWSKNIFNFFATENPSPMCTTWSWVYEICLHRKWEASYSTGYYSLRYQACVLIA
jgi:hypothetical protein